MNRQESAEGDVVKREDGVAGAFGVQPIPASPVFAWLHGLLSVVFSFLYFCILVLLLNLFQPVRYILILGVAAGSVQCVAMLGKSTVKQNTSMSANQGQKFSCLDCKIIWTVDVPFQR